MSETGSPGQSVHDTVVWFVSGCILDRLHHDQSVHEQYGSVQRTSRRNRSLKGEKEVLATLEDAGIDRERVTSIDSRKVNEALEVTELSETDVYEVDESEYVRKAEINEDVKESRLQGLKHRLAASGDVESDELRQEVEALEERIDDLTSFSTGTRMQGQTSAEYSQNSVLVPEMSFMWDINFE